MTPMQRTASLACACALSIALGAPAAAQASSIPGAPQGATRDPALDFLRPYGLDHFSPHYVQALSTLLGAQRDYRHGDYAQAQARLDALWLAYPEGDVRWGFLPRRPFGINLGTPPCYYGLRMLSDMTAWRLAQPGAPPPPRSVRLTVLVPGVSSGIEPRTLEELLAGTGVFAVHALDPRVPAADYRVVRESLRLFEEYVLAMTGGQLGVETRILPLPAVNLPVQASVGSNGGFFAAPVDSAQIFDFVPQAEIEATDWWWLLYPSHVPEQYPDFTTSEFITGGMGTGADSASPLFIIDDRWLVRKPPHLGTGSYSFVERSVYLPQWLQHEFFHHLFRTYPEFGLEASSHQWFDLGTWPADFVGRYEADYYHEALTKRLQGATIPLHVALRYATAGAPWDQLTIADLLGTYQREPVENPWHIGDIRFAGPQLEWRNTAPVRWNLQDDLAHGALLTGPDCPYWSLASGKKFNVVLERDALGDLTTTIRGFSFLGELYQRQ